MSGRHDDYVTELGYTRGYFSELSLPHLRLALLKHGFAPPDIRTCCEMGFGQGLSLAIHAAASPAVWYGTDINAEHMAAATELVRSSGATAHLHQEPFADLAERTDVPPFDFVGMNGVWSWVSEQTRGTIVDFLRRKLKPGGVLFVSYISSGWRPFQPLQELLAAHAHQDAQSQTPLTERMEASLAFAERLRQAAPGYLEDNPRADEYLDDLAAKDRRFLAHDLFNRHYHPMSLAAVRTQLAQAGLVHAGSADLGDLDAIRLTPKQRQLLDTIEESALRESVRDFLVNRFARRDYFIKGPAKTLSPEERLEALRRMRFIALRPHPELPAKLRAVLTLQRTGLTEELQRPIFEALASLSPLSLERAENLAKSNGRGGAEALDVLLLGAATGQLSPIQDATDIEPRRPFTRALNARLVEKPFDEDDTEYLASPVTGAGVAVRRRLLPLLSSHRDGGPGPDSHAGQIAVLRALGIA